MEVQQLALVVTEKDLNELARKHLPKDFPIDNLQIQIVPEGVRVSGEIQVFMPVTFHTLWEPQVREGKVTARLLSIKALGVPVTVFRSMILKVVHEAAGQAHWVEYENDLLVADIDKLTVKEGVILRSNLRSIECGAGSLIVRAGT